MEQSRRIGIDSCSSCRYVLSFANNKDVSPLSYSDNLTIPILKFTIARKNISPTKSVKLIHSCHPQIAEGSCFRSREEQRISSCLSTNQSIATSMLTDDFSPLREVPKNCLSSAALLHTKATLCPLQYDHYDNRMTKSLGIFQAYRNGGSRKWSAP